MNRPKPSPIREPEYTIIHVGWGRLGAGLIFIVLLIAALVWSVSRALRPDSDRTTALSGLPADLSAGVELTEGDKQILIDTAFQAVYDHNAGNPEPASFSAAFDGIDNTVFAGLRLDGVKRGSWSAKTDNLLQTVYRATLSTLDDTRYGQLTAVEAAKSGIELFILGPEHTWDAGYEPGIHGVRLTDGVTSAIYYNSVAVESGKPPTNELISRLCQKAGLPATCNDDPAVQLSYFPTLHLLASSPFSGVTTLYRCAVLHEPGSIDAAMLDTSTAAMQTWLLQDQRSIGSFGYIWDPIQNKYSTEDQVLRQMIASVSLANISTSVTAYSVQSERNLRYIMSSWYAERDRIGFVAYQEASNIGVSSFLVRSLLASPQYETYGPQAESLITGIKTSQQADGSFLVSLFSDPDSSESDQEQIIFYSGEAILALVEYYEKTGDQAALEAAIQAQDYYLVEYVDQLSDNYSPFYVPWHSMSLAHLYEVTGDIRYRQAVYALNLRRLADQNTDGKPYADQLGRTEDQKNGVVGIAADAVFLEGLTYAYELAYDQGDIALADQFGQGMRYLISEVMNAQFLGPDLYFITDIPHAEGGVRFPDQTIRVDTVAHAYDAFTRVQSLIKAGKYDL